MKTLLSLCLPLLAVSCSARSCGSTSASLTPAPSGGPATGSEPTFHIARSAGGVVIGVVGDARSMMMELLGDVEVEEYEDGLELYVQGRRMSFDFDRAEEFLPVAGMPTAAQLHEHMRWRFGVEWRHSLTTLDLARRVRAGEKMDESTRVRRYAPGNVREGVLADGTPVLAWEVDVQEAGGVAPKADAPAIVAHRTIPLGNGVVVIMTDVRTNEREQEDALRAAFDAHVQTAVFHEGALDFPGYAEAKGWPPIEPEDGAASDSQLASACESGDPRACSALGMRYLAGEGGERDPERARIYFTKGCDGDEPQSCLGLGALYADGLGVEVDRKRAAKLLDKSCKLGLPQGCAVQEQLKAQAPEQL